MNSARNPFTFYQFLGAHSLLIGLLPFFLPVYLWGNGYRLLDLCVLIGMSGLSFSASLGIWQLAATRLALSSLLTLTFLLECALVVLVAWAGSPVWLPLVLGVVSGAYNAFFWTTQRTLFTQLLGANDSGRQYGNFQIFVTVFLKIGILAGGLLLDAGGLPWILALSALVGLLMSWWFSTQLDKSTLIADSSVNFKQSLKHSDNLGSRPVFIIDGLFLFLESHFWTLSLFLVVREDYSRLGIAVVVLALVFALLFYLLKNMVDQFAPQHVYVAAVILYCASWILRAYIDMSLPMEKLFVLLVVITFCSSFFRLAFNKRFFDLARGHGSVRYLLIKSYLSQFFLGIGFLSMAGLLWMTKLPDDATLIWIYGVAAAVSLVYLQYRRGAMI